MPRKKTKKDGKSCPLEALMYRNQPQNTSTLKVGKLKNFLHYIYDGF
jgi:hypothetical protein